MVVTALVCLRLRACRLEGAAQLIGARGGLGTAGVAIEHSDNLLNRHALHELRDGLEVAVAAAHKRAALDNLARIVQVNMDAARAHPARREIDRNHKSSPARA